MTAGTDVDLINRARLAVRSANEGSGGGGVDVLGEDAGLGGVLEGFEGGLEVRFAGGTLLAFCVTAGGGGGGDGLEPDTFPACDAHIEATAATLPPLPPRADLISYFTSGSSGRS